MANDTRIRTMVDWDRGGFENLYKDIIGYKRRGLRLKQLAALGLAAEAKGLGILYIGKKAVLTGHLVEPEKGADVEAPTPIAESVEKPVRRQNRAAGKLVSQFAD